MTALAVVMLVVAFALNWWPQSKTAASPPVLTPATPLPRDEARALATVSASPTIRTSAAELIKHGDLPAGHAETRLLEIFALVEQSQLPQALLKSDELVRDHPNFHLAQLVHGDLLKLRYQPATALGGVSPEQAQAAGTQLAALRAESRQRLDALQNRPPPGTVPQQFVAVSAWSSHAIAVDASRSRLYLFENTAGTSQNTTGTPSLKLIGDFFISVGKDGVGKQVEGDGRTPLGTYYITSVRDKKTLPAFYGAGALPLNYPNAVDIHQGRTGRGIWLHGTPPNMFVRATLASEGCVVLSNPDMQLMLDNVMPRTTPVVIAEHLQWVTPQAQAADRDTFEQVILSWQHSRSAMSAQAMRERYGPALADDTDTDASDSPKLRNAAKSSPAIDDGSRWLAPPQVELGLTNLSLLQNTTPEHSMVATFEETVFGQRTGTVRRQYWLLQQGRWQLLQDTVLSGPPSPSLATPTAPPLRTPVQATVTAPPSKVTGTVTANAQVKAADSKTAVAVASVPPATGSKSIKTSALPLPIHGHHPEEEAIRQAVAAWMKAWSQKNMTAYFKAYDSTFVTPVGQSRKAWEQDRKDRIVNKNTIRISLSNITIQLQGQVATVRFTQNYQADALNVSGRKTLKLIQRGKQWAITHEQVG
jgi:murein L,D-transpeptidase YafK